MMGYEFATYVNKYLESQGVPTRSIAKIDSNPEKSKHLETATTKLFNQEVDFCNLRTEIYEEGSRIPSQIVSCPFNRSIYFLYLTFRNRHLVHLQKMLIVVILLSTVYFIMLILMRWKTLQIRYCTTMVEHRRITQIYQFIT